MSFRAGHGPASPSGTVAPQPHCIMTPNVDDLREGRRLVSCKTGPMKRDVHRRYRRWARQMVRIDESRLSDVPRTKRLTSWNIA